MEPEKNSYVGDIFSRNFHRMKFSWFLERWQFKGSLGLLCVNFTTNIRILKFEWLRWKIIVFFGLVIDIVYLWNTMAFLLQSSSDEKLSIAYSHLPLIRNIVSSSPMHISSRFQFTLTATAFPRQNNEMFILIIHKANLKFA